MCATTRSKSRSFKYHVTYVHVHCASIHQVYYEVTTFHLLQTMVRLQDKFDSVQVLLEFCCAPDDGKAFPFDGGISSLSWLQLPASKCDWPLLSSTVLTEKNCYWSYRNWSS